MHSDITVTVMLCPLPKLTYTENILKPMKKLLFQYKEDNCPCTHHSRGLSLKQLTVTAVKLNKCLDHLVQQIIHCQNSYLSEQLYFFICPFMLQIMRANYKEKYKLFKDAAQHTSHIDRSKLSHLSRCCLYSSLSTGTQWNLNSCLVSVVLPGHKSVFRLKSLEKKEPPFLPSLILASDALYAV